MEAGPLRQWLVRIALLLLVLGITAYIGIRQFNGLRSFEAMDLAQQARQLAEGKGLTTLVIRPLALWQTRTNLESAAPLVTNFPETLTPPLYPALLAAGFKVGVISKVITFDLPAEDLKGFRTFRPDLVVLVFQLFLLVATAFAVFFWAQKQFDIGTAVLAMVFFLGSSPVWTSAVSGGATLLVVFLYGLAGWLFCQGISGQEPESEVGESRLAWVWPLGAGLILGATALVQMIQIWPALAGLGLGWVLLQKGRWAWGIGLLVSLALFAGWLCHLWLVSGNPIGLNWAFFLADSARFPGETIWRTYTLNLEQTDVWRRVGGSVLRGFTDLISQGPALVGNAVAGTLALIACLHSFRHPSAASGRNFWGGVAVVLILATAFIQRSNQETEGHAILMALLPVTCVYGAAYFWILVERLRLHLELLGRLLAIVVALVASWPTMAKVLLPEPAPFAYPPTYPPIFIFMRSWFEAGELQSSDLPAAEAWYAEQPTLWIPTTRADFLKIHDRVAPIFSILLTPESSDTRMYSQMLAENSEWGEWADLIRRQKPPDLPQAFATSLPPNNDYLLLSIQKRWN